MSGEFDIKELKGEEWLRKLNRLNELNEARKIETREEKEYKEVLMKDFGFDERIANLILKVKRAIDKKFAHLIKEKRFYIFNRIIGELHYNGLEWDETSGNLGNYFYKEEVISNIFEDTRYRKIPYSLEEIYKELGLTKKEYSQLIYELGNQHRFSGEKASDGNEMLDNINNKSYEGNNFKEEYAKYKKVYGEHLTIKDFIEKWNRDKEAYYGAGDYTHQAITMSAVQNKGIFRLANGMGLLYKPLKFHKYTTELAGWRGDVTNQAFKEPSMNGDDYKADLDAENILHLYNKDKSRDYMKVYNEYYKGIREGTINRAKMFKEIVGLEYVRNEVRIILIKKFPLFYVKDDESLKKYNPVAYNFIKNLENDNNEFIEYVKQEKRNEK